MLRRRSKSRPIWSFETRPQSRGPIVRRVLRPFGMMGGTSIICKWSRALMKLRVSSTACAIGALLLACVTCNCLAWCRRAQFSSRRVAIHLPTVRPAPTADRLGGKFIDISSRQAWKVRYIQAKRPTARAAVTYDLIGCRRRRGVDHFWPTNRRLLYARRRSTWCRRLVWRTLAQIGSISPLRRDRRI
jgi:hypothetical protein